MLARLAGRLDEARALHEQARALRRSLGDRWGVAGSLGNLSALVNGKPAQLVGSGSPATLVFGPTGQLTG